MFSLLGRFGESCSDWLFLDILKIHNGLSPDFGVILVRCRIQKIEFLRLFSSNCNDEDSPSGGCYPWIVMVCRSSAQLWAGLSQRQRTLNPNLDMTSLLNKLAADNITNMTVPPNIVEEAKDRSGNLVDIYWSAEMIGRDYEHTVIKDTW